VDGGVLPPPSHTVLIANPTADVYGSDLQMKESVAGLRERGWRVVVAVPGRGPLVRELLDLGAEVQLLPYPVLRRASASPAGLARLAVAAPWIVLLFMSLQSDVIHRYASPGGVVVLTIGAAACLVAYRAMMRIGRLPTERRLLS